MSNLQDSDRTRLHNLEVQQRELKSAVDDNTTAVQTLTESTQQLVEAWEAARWLINFVQLLSKFLLAVAAIWVMFKGIPEWVSHWRGK